MINTIEEFCEGAQVRRLISQVETDAIATDLGGITDSPVPDTAEDRLRIIASLALAAQIGHQSVDQLLRILASDAELSDESSRRSVFEKWDAYLSSVIATGQEPTLDDLVYYSAAGLLARQQVEVRSTLRSFGSTALNAGVKTDPTDWPSLVKASIGSALLHVIRQADRSDLLASMDAIDRLAEQQKEMEVSWLDEQGSPATDAVGLLGYYHLARAVSRTSEFLMAGSAESAGEFSTDIGPELRRLLTRADEYLSLSSDVDTQFWLKAVAVLLWILRADSVWVAGRGISRRLDRLLDELARGERERNVFSLLPSQQDAIRANLMDASRLAIVLQMPTSSGKTLLAEFAILQTFDAFTDSARVVYLVPTRALATQTFRTLAEDLTPLGVEVAAAASAYEEDPYELELLRTSRGVIVATPEKLDLLLRSHPEWFEDLRLVVVDEAHLLSDSERGVRLELLLANIRRERPEARLLLMTPFIENANAIATWLGGGRGLPITVQWRPVRLLLGLAELVGRGEETSFVTHWKEPYRPHAATQSVRISAGVNKTALATTKNKVAVLAQKFGRLGSVLALYSGSKRGPEEVAVEVAERSPHARLADHSPALRVAIAIAREEFGTGSRLAYCLERGVAYHHASLSPTLRYLIEDQVRAGRISFVAATTTLAQGMNFPVASVLVHSVHKPYGKGNLSPSEFWNIAGRAGRTGMVEKGFVVFANEAHREHWHRYGAHLSTHVRSALLDVLVSLGAPGVSLKEQYRRYEELRPFIQYLAHAAASTSAADAIDDLDELLQGSLANAQIRDEEESRVLKRIAHQYLSELTGLTSGILKVADRTGLGSFSFTELFAKIRSDSLLRAGPRVLIERREEGMVALVEALRWLPELNLAIGKGPGDMDVGAVARVLQGWLDGRRIVDLSQEFPGGDEEARTRNAGAYIFGTVSQTVAWGAHAYLRGWGMGQPAESSWEASEAAMLPAYIQHGVNTPEAAVASLLGVPRPVAEPLAGVFRDRHGHLEPAQAGRLRDFVQTADISIWEAALAESRLEASAADVRAVWRQMRGLVP